MKINSERNSQIAAANPLRLKRYKDRNNLLASWYSTLQDSTTAKVSQIEANSDQLSLVKI